MFNCDENDKIDLTDLQCREMKLNLYSEDEVLCDMICEFNHNENDTINLKEFTAIMMITKQFSL